MDVAPRYELLAGMVLAFIGLSIASNSGGAVGLGGGLFMADALRRGAIPDIRQAWGDRYRFGEQRIPLIRGAFAVFSACIVVLSLLQLAGQ